MARYGDLDKLSEQITTNHCGACGIYNGEMCCSCPMNDALRYIDEFPTADVAPDGAYQQVKWERDIAIKQLEHIGLSLGEKTDGYGKKSEVARDIFEDIREKGKFNEPIVDYVCLSFEELAEIEKKYTEHNT